MEYSNDNPLGKTTKYKTSYDAGLLFPIDRKDGRERIGLGEMANDNLPFKGYDAWNCFELSWLSESGKPEVRVLHFFVPYDSPRIVESKSVKLYLNSFNNTKFESAAKVFNTIKKDISEVCGADVIFHMRKLDDIVNEKISQFSGTSLDEIDTTINEYEVDPSTIQLDASGKEVQEDLYSDLLRSNCLVTGQPDWASVRISYEGKKIDHESLLRYIVSFRNHIEFHEQCVERIFTDIMNRCLPSKLTVQAKYTRRGGIDINPVRSSFVFDATSIDNSRLPRQ